MEDIAWIFYGSKTAQPAEWTSDTAALHNLRPCTSSEIICTFVEPTQCKEKNTQRYALQNIFPRFMSSCRGSSDATELSRLTQQLLNNNSPRRRTQSSSYSRTSKSSTTMFRNTMNNPSVWSNVQIFKMKRDCLLKVGKFSYANICYTWEDNNKLCSMECEPGTVLGNRVIIHNKLASRIPIVSYPVCLSYTLMWRSLIP